MRNAGATALNRQLQECHPPQAPGVSLDVMNAVEALTQTYRWAMQVPRPSSGSFGEVTSDKRAT